MASADEENSQNNTNDDQNNEEPVTIIPGYSSIDDFTKDGFKTLIEATRHANSLPQDNNWDFYKTHESFRKLMSNEGDNILTLINDILKKEGIHGNIKNRDLEQRIELIVEANDMILERVADNLDEFAGIKKNPQLPVEIQTVSAELPVNGSWNKINNAKFSVSSASSSNFSPTLKSPNAVRLLTGKNIQRPQKFFKDLIDNSSRTPWEPRIKEKPNSLKPLAVYLEETEDGLGEIFCHPYEFELDRFEPPAEQLTYVKPVVPKQLSETPLRIIEKEEELNALVEDLRKYKEIAVDLEHHSYRTFLGITCLMQISTGDTDYLIDTLALRDKICILNEVFTKPSIVKIFHGADSDIIWLQRDLSLYIVNMFDTHQAAKQLGYAHLSLAYLLKKFCCVDADKHFQLADWRIRPLPEELKTYAREDTHYLIYIYHMMRNELLDRANKDSNILRSVIQNSTAICQRRYIKPTLRQDSHLDLYRRCKKLFDNRQMFALKELYKWRDQMARDEDESTGYVLPNHMMLQIAEILPREMQGILACCNPIPPLVQANLLELHKLILKAREQPVVKPILSEETRSRGSTVQFTKMNVDNPLNCPHELSKTEFRDDLPTLLGNILKLKQDKQLNKDEKQPKNCEETCLITNIKQEPDALLPIECHKAQCSVFNSPESSDNENENNEIRKKVQKLKFLGPFERYKLVKPFIQAEEEKQAQEEAEKDQSKPEERTDEERVEAVKDFFKIAASSTTQVVPGSNPDEEKVSKNHPTNTPLGEKISKNSPLSDKMSKNTPLSEMPGRKRKRADSEPDDEDSDSDNECVATKNLETPVPNMTKKDKKRNKRLQRLNGRYHTALNNPDPKEREIAKMYFDRLLTRLNIQPGQSNQVEPDSNRKQLQNKNNANPNNRKRKSNDFNQSINSQDSNSPRNNQRGGKRKRGNADTPNSNSNRDLNRDSNYGSNRGSTRDSTRGSNRGSNRDSTRGSNRGSTRGLNRGSNRNSNRDSYRDSNRNSNDQQPFDYSSVDFRQYQGGAGSVDKGQNVRSNFKSRGSKNKKFQNIGRTNTRSSTFDGGRGRGRGRASFGGNR